MLFSNLIALFFLLLFNVLLWENIEVRKLKTSRVMMIVHNINTIYQENKMLACLINIKIIIFNTLVLVVPLESWIISKSDLLERKYAKHARSRFATQLRVEVE